MDVLHDVPSAWRHLFNKDEVPTSAEWPANHTQVHERLPAIRAICNRREADDGMRCVQVGLGKSRRVHPHHVSPTVERPANGPLCLGVTVQRSNHLVTDAWRLSCQEGAHAVYREERLCAQVG